MTALAANLGMNSEATPRNTQGVSVSAANEDQQQWPAVDNGKDYYVTRNGVQFAGTHLLIDLWGAQRLDDIDLVEESLRRLLSGCQRLIFLYCSYCERQSLDAHN